MNLVGKIKKHGVLGSAEKALGMAIRRGRNVYNKWAVRNAPRCNNPTILEFDKIERDLLAAGITVHDYSPRAEDFMAFQAADYFPFDYHGGCPEPVWDEKLLEHWIAAERLGLASYQPMDVYIDVAAGSSPWAKVLRERFGISAFAIDLEVGPAFKELPFYRMGNATATTFADASVKGASLQCAYEMFTGDGDTNLLKEFSRILTPGGKVIILPLYMHTHYCAYSTAEYYGKGNSDALAQEYVCLDWNGIPSARFYDVNALIRRVLDPIEHLGMRYQLLALRNKADFGMNIYCHFVLEITK